MRAMSSLDFRVTAMGDEKSRRLRESGCGGNASDDPRWVFMPDYAMISGWFLKFQETKFPVSAGKGVPATRGSIGRPARDRPTLQEGAAMSVTMRQVLEAGVHFGHQTRCWNPRMAQYIFGH